MYGFCTSSASDRGRRSLFLENSKNACGSLENSSERNNKYRSGIRGGRSETRSSRTTSSAEGRKSWFDRVRNYLHVVHREAVTWCQYHAACFYSDRAAPNYIAKMKRKRAGIMGGMGLGGSASGQQDYTLGVGTAVINQAPCASTTFPSHDEQDLQGANDNGYGSDSDSDGEETLTSAFADTPGGRMRRSSSSQAATCQRRFKKGLKLSIGGAQNPRAARAHKRSHVGKFLAEYDEFCAHYDTTLGSFMNLGYWNLDSLVQGSSSSAAS